MAFVEACCNTPPTNAEWVNKGVDKVLLTKVNGEDRLTYRTGPKDSKRGIIGVYDIFGFHPTTYQFFDRLALAKGGFQVSVPHMFKKPSPAAELMGNRTALMEWVSQHGDYKNSHLDALIRAAVQDLRADGCTSFSIIGQCWGTWIAVQAASEEDSVFLAVGGPHPSRTTIETVKDVRCPLVIVATKDEDDMIPVVESVKHKNFAVESVHKRFDNMHHGFCGSRGDWSDPEQFKAALETIDIIAGYCGKVVEVSEQRNK